MLMIENDGQLIKKTNYFESELARAGKFFLSMNAGAFRLLIPESLENAIKNEIKLAKSFIIVRGPWHQMHIKDALELIFDDKSDEPFSLQLTEKSLDRWPNAGDEGKEFVLTIWVKGLKTILNTRIKYKRVSEIPCVINEFRF